MSIRALKIKKSLCVLFSSLMLFLLAARATAASPTSPNSSSARTLHSKLFGDLPLYGNLTQPDRVVLFFSGDGGWNLGVVEMARKLADAHTMVIGLDIRRVFAAMNVGSSKCSYPAGQLEGISKSVQKKLLFRKYITPIVVGYSSGATLVYGLMAQAPVGTFAGGVSLGFCPDLEISKPMCKGRSLRSVKAKKAFLLEPDPQLGSPWVVLHGARDEVCTSRAAKEFVAKIPAATLVDLPRVGHGFSVQKNWMPQFEKVFRDTFSVTSPALQGNLKRNGQQNPPRAKESGEQDRLEDLPLVWKLTEKSRDVVIFMSGDGGWATLDEDVTDGLNKAGVSVVGLNMLRYFWNAKTPASAAADLDFLVVQLRNMKKFDRVFLAGYSLGADAAPVIFNEMKNTQAVKGLVLLGASKMANFEFHVSDWLDDSPDKDDIPVLPAVRKIIGSKVLCVYGDEDEDSVCPELDPGRFVVKKLQGGHHFGGDFAQLATEMLAFMKNQ